LENPRRETVYDEGDRRRYWLYAEFSVHRDFVSGKFHGGVETLESIANIEYQSR
jgi:hypothetical protein